jgi:hypothetical protein
LALIICGVGIWAGTAAIFLAGLLLGVNVGPWGGLVGRSVVFAALALVTLGRRRRVRVAESAVADDQRAPVVFLRPFTLDKLRTVRRLSSRVRISPWEEFEPRFEQRLARVLRGVGPFIAVGDPAERLPQLGAARFYVGDDEWQAQVDALIARASIVVLHAGTGEGITWEVNRVVAEDRPQRLVLSLPLDAKRRAGTRQARYAAFRPLFPRPLPETIGHSQFVFFDHDWTPHLLGNSAPVGDDERALALRALAREFKVAWGPRWLRLTVYTGPVVALLVAGLVLVLI